MKRVGYPADIAAAAAFLCSDGRHCITGQTLYVDGGMELDSASRRSLTVGAPPRGRLRLHSGRPGIVCHESGEPCAVPP